MSNVEREKISQTKIYLRHYLHTTSHDIHGLDWVKYLWWHEGTIAALLSFFSKLKAEDNLNTGQYINYQTFSNLQFKPLLKNFFHSHDIDLKDTSGEKRPFVSVGITRIVLMFRKASNIPF